MNKNERDLTDGPAEQNSADDALAIALHELAASTNVDPTFADALEAKLLMRADAMIGDAPARVPPWQRLQQWARNAISVRPLRYSIAMTGLVLALLLLSTPVVRATLWDWLYSTGLIAEQAVTDRTVPLEAPIVEKVARQSLQELQAQAPFAVAPPAWLPHRLAYTNGFVDMTATGTQVTLAFHLPGNRTGTPSELVEQPLLFMLVSDRPVEDRPLLAEEGVRPVQIRPESGGSALAMYAHGGWRSTLPVTPESDTVDDLYWDATADEAWLSWQMGGLNYLLYAQGLGVTEQEMVRIAESIESE